MPVVRVHQQLVANQGKFLGPSLPIESVVIALSLYPILDQMQFPKSSSEVLHTVGRLFRDVERIEQRRASFQGFKLLSRLA